MAQPNFITFERTSFIPNVSQDEVWQQIGTWAGVNYELGPILQMTYPKQYARLVDIPADGNCYFTARIRLFGLVPVDRHAFSLVALEAPRHFHEESSNLNMVVWTHKRTLEVRDGGVEITDSCRFVPRLFFMGRVLKTMFAWVFKRRHDRLIQHFSVAQRGPQPRPLVSG